MLLDLEIKITITNDGSSNDTELTTNGQNKITDLLTSLELAKNALMTGLSEYAKNTGSLPDEEIKAITLNDLYKSR